METLQELEPRDMGTLRGVDGLYLNPEDGQPYSGPVFGENNGKRMTGSLRDGKWDGPFESYHENGQLRRRGTYKDGVEDGPVEEYYDNGQLYEKGSYKDGEPCGEWFEGETVTYDPC
jgi:antitoxin component YwqK of YwqJK toxin-antitoxin module